MTGQARRSTVAAFGADPSSSGSARTFVRDALSRMEVDPEIIDQAVLVVSELVTNAVLHAKCGPVITVQTDDETVRLEVEDASEAFPLLRNYGGEAVTGRGLAVVDASATWWGVDATETGKTIWAEFSRIDRRKPEHQPSGPVQDQPAKHKNERLFDEEAPELIEVTFVAVPVDVYMVLEQHHEALLREFELLSIDASEGRESAVPPNLVALVEQIRPVLSGHIASHREVVHSAFASGQTHVNLRTAIEAGMLHRSRAFVQVMKQAEDLACSGTLLTSPAPGAVTALRDWFIEELNRQVSDRRSPRPAPSFVSSEP